MRVTVAVMALGTAVLMCGPISIQASSAYDFEGLTAGSLSGQDGWRPVYASGSDSANVRIPTTGINLTKVHAAFAIGVMIRKNDANWSFTPFVGNETNAIMQFDARLTSNNGILLFGLGFDANSNGNLDEQGPLFGINNNNFTVQRAAGVGSTVASGIGSAGSSGDWLQLQLKMDFTANAGDGAGSLYYRNLTTSQSTFTAVAALQNINLGLLSLASIYNAPPSTWNTLVVSLTNTSYNESTLRDAALDNLVPTNAIPTPEPSSFMLVMIGMTLLFARRRACN